MHLICQYLKDVYSEPLLSRTWVLMNSSLYRIIFTVPSVLARKALNENVSLANTAFREFFIITKENTYPKQCFYF